MVCDSTCGYDVGTTGGRDMTQSERFGLIERMLLSRRSVTFADLQQRLGVSRATLFRDLRDLKDRMGVPVVLDRDTGTYRIDRHG